jgi:hypothetical protein
MLGESTHQSSHTLYLWGAEASSLALACLHNVCEQWLHGLSRTKSSLALGLVLEGLTD